jgi:outer membrane protein assembly factor BamB
LGSAASTPAGQLYTDDGQLILPAPLHPDCSDNNLPYRDANGFRKLIVVLTAPGKLYGLHSGDGRILWASSASTAAASSSSKQHLKLWRRFHDLTHAPQVVVLTAGQQQSELQVFNAHTGQQLQQAELQYGVDKVGVV